MPEINLAEWIDNGSRLLVSDDLMQAELYLCPPPAKQEYTLELLQDYLSSKRLRNGVKDELLSGILRKKQYYTKVRVAVGTPVKDGEDGSYQFLFDTETNKTPKVLPDGSVDYRTLTNIPTVKEGAIIARYHPATEGTAGMNLYGSVIPARNGRELPELKGKGFCVSEDRRTYMATISGKIEMENGRINIKNFLEVKEDVDTLTGDIEFDGDVLIHGNVSGGRRVRAGGNLTIEGCVEACELYAGKDIVLARGMQGGGRGVAECKGSVSGKFFEQMKIVAGKNVSANSILNCRVEAGVDIEVAGRHGAILGGSVFAGHWIQATTVGNIAEVQTELTAGDSDELNGQMQRLEAECRQLEEQMHKT
ncbi:MAG: FapA family protein, partial [Lachnospiraceae bacterium]|nr:FapA family protein [Lachnospiraceae bacterium]